MTARAKNRFVPSVTAGIDGAWLGSNFVMIYIYIYIHVENDIMSALLSAVFCLFLKDT